MKPAQRVTGSRRLLYDVRSGFIQQGKSLSKWCAEEGVCRQYATAVIVGQRNGPAAKALRSRIVAASGARIQAEAA